MFSKALYVCKFLFVVWWKKVQVVLKEALMGHTKVRYLSLRDCYSGALSHVYHLYLTLHKNCLHVMYVDHYLRLTACEER